MPATTGFRTNSSTPLVLFATCCVLTCGTLWLSGTALAGTTSGDDAEAQKELADAPADADDSTDPMDLDLLDPIDPIEDGLHPLDAQTPDDRAEEIVRHVSEGEGDAVSGRRRVRRVRRRVVRRRVIRTHPHHSHRRVVVVTNARRGHDDGKRVLARPERAESKVSAGLRFAAVSLGDTDLGNETFHGATLGGIGGYIRGRFLKHFGLEFSADVMGNFDGEYDQLTIPVLAGFTAHIFPTSTLDIYGIAGGGVLINSIDYQAPDVKGGGTRTFSETFLQLGGQLGGGIELDLGALELITDLRYLVLQPRPERSPELRDAVPMTAGGDEDAVTHALQFMLGIGGNF